MDFLVLIKQVYLLIYHSEMELLDGLVKHTYIFVTYKYDGVLWNFAKYLLNIYIYQDATKKKFQSISSNLFLNFIIDPCYIHVYMSSR